MGGFDMRFEEYFEPASIEECLKLKQQFGADAAIIAGGTDVVPKLKSGDLKPKAVISLHRIPELDDIDITDSGLKLGACTGLRKISLAEELDADYSVVREAVGRVSSMQIRNTATIGGNVCNAAPSADAVQGLMLLDALCLIKDKDGLTEKPISEFFTGPGETVLEETQLVTGFFIPKPAPETGAAYIKYAIRGNTDISIVGVGAAISLDAGGIVDKARISLAAVAPTPIRATDAEKVLEGSEAGEADIERAAELAADGCSPISDQRASAEYRKEMVRIQCKLAIEKAISRM